MKIVRLSKHVQRVLAAQKLRDIEMRRQANSKAQLARRDRGRIRLEKTVPDQFRVALREIVKTVITLREAGHLVQLVRKERPVDYMSSFHDSVSDIEEQQPAESKLPAGVSQCQISARSRQNARRRARAKQAGRVRTTYEIPIELRAEISAILDRAIEHFCTGYDVAVAPALIDQVSEPAVFRKKPSTLSVPSAAAPPQECAGTLSVQATTGSQNDDSRQTKENQLFWDIQAAAKIP
jgi:hypothetical protein